LRPAQFPLQKKSLEDPMSTSDWVWWRVPVVPATQVGTNRIAVQASLSIKQDPVSEMTGTMFIEKKATLVVFTHSRDHVFSQKVL
jgi:hypothetical protein